MTSHTQRSRIRRTDLIALTGGAVSSWFTIVRGVLTAMESRSFYIFPVSIHGDGPQKWSRGENDKCVLPSQYVCGDRYDTDGNQREKKTDGRLSRKRCSGVARVGYFAQCC